MIEKALNTVGITVSYPQRDIRFDSTQALKVEVSSSPGQQKTESTDG